jgi:MFS family permease
MIFFFSSHGQGIVLKILAKLLSSMPRVLKPKPKMSPKEEEHLKKRARNLSIREGSGYSVMDGFGFRYITPYALAVGANDTVIGLLSSLPSLVGSFFQLYTLKLISRMSRKNLCILGAGVQALLWLLVLAVGTLYFVFGIKGITPVLLLIIYTTLVIFGTMLGPAWTSWMKDIVGEHYGAYFGTRNRVVGFVLLVSIIFSGFILDYFRNTNLFLGFIILFTIAFAGRLFSAITFTQKYEPEFKGYHEYHTFGYVLKRMPRELFGKFTIFLTLISLTTAIASPYFAVYMLRELHFSYTVFMIITISSIVSTILLMPAWGRFADKYGNRRVMIVTGFMIPFVPALWLASTLVPTAILIPYLFVAELFSGFCWSGFNLASGNYIYDVVLRENIPLYSASYNILTNLGTFIGALIGSFLVAWNVHWIGLTGLLFVFLISGITRMLAFLVFIPSIKEIRPVPEFGVEQAAEQFKDMSIEKVGRLLR